VCAAAEVSLNLEFVARAMLSGIALYFVLFALIVYLLPAGALEAQSAE
jgi:hypothetical protein